MAKMMMGQIDHARSRLHEITEKKLGEEPKSPSVLTLAELKKKILDGNLIVGRATLNAAYDAWIQGKTFKRITHKSGGWNYNTRQNEKGGYFVKEEAPSSIDEAILFILTEEEILVEADWYNSELANYERRKEILKQESRSVEDAIVLGDQHAALQALQEFMAFEV